MGAYDVFLAYLLAGIFWLPVDVYCSRKVVVRLIDEGLFPWVVLCCVVDVVFWPAMILDRIRR